MGHVIHGPDEKLPCDSDEIQFFFYCKKWEDLIELNPFNSYRTKATDLMDTQKFYVSS